MVIVLLSHSFLLPFPLPVSQVGRWATYKYSDSGALALNKRRFRYQPIRAGDCRVAVEKVEGAGKGIMNMRIINIEEGSMNHA